jgi:hypothetical protein
MPQELPSEEAVRGRPKRLESMLLALVACLALSLPLLDSLPTLDLLAALIAILGVFAVVVYRDRPLACLAALATTAWCSRTVVDFLGLSIRVEQPAVVVLAAWLLWRHHALILSVARQYVVAIAGIGVWLAAILLSSYLKAPNPGASLRIEAWLCISILSAGVAAVLALRLQSNRDAGSAFVLAAAVQVGIALFALVTGRFLGIAWGGYWLVDGSGVFRAFALVWEPNIFGSCVAIVAPFAVDRFIRLGRPIDLIPLSLVSLGLGIALTRAAWIAVLAGLISYACIMAVRENVFVAHVARQISAALIVLVFGSLLGIYLTAWGQGASPGLLAQRAPAPETIQVPALASGIAIAASSPGATSAPTASPTVGPAIAVDLTSGENIAYRAKQAVQALSDILTSPAIGLGANSYGQRHVGSSQANLPDYLSTFPLTVLYDSGLVGAAGFGVFVLSMVLAMWKSSDRRLAAPYLASMVVMAVAYVATDALRFSQNWLIFGAALGLACRPALRGDADLG